MLLTMLFKAADLGHVALDWDQHLEWSLRLAEEFYQQGEHEERLGLSISPLCNRSKHGSYAKTQAGYIHFVVVVSLQFSVWNIYQKSDSFSKPLMEELAELVNDGNAE